MEQDEQPKPIMLIATISVEEADEPLRAIYARVAGPDGAIDNILTAHSLRPHTLEGHMGLYKAVLHHRGNQLPKWLLETIGVMVSQINRCSYCVDHHLAGLERLLARSPERFAMIKTALARAQEPFPAIETALAEALTPSVLAAMRYASALTRDPSSIGADEFKKLREAGLDDGEILEINQVAAYFAYANRTVLGLGCTIDGDTLGHSPGDDDNPDNWAHG